MKRLHVGILVCSVSAFAAGAFGAGGCGGGGTSNDTGDDAAAVTDSGGATDVATNDAASDTSGPAVVSFSYTPQWKGVTKVEVVGGFGQASDFSKTASLLTLTDDGTGKYTGTTTLPAGTYAYVFRVTGDDAAADGAKFERYAVDPLDSAFAACPMQSPTYSKTEPNPCSQLTVPQGATATPVHVKGSITLDGSAAAGWLVLLEREEAQSHHFFANRVTVGQDGKFDLIATAGQYRLQVQHPTLLNTTDLGRNPTALAALRRAISSSFAVAAADVTVTAPDLAFHGYGAFAPTGNGGTLPTTFAFETGAQARLDVYGGPGDGGVVEIGDPWYAGPPVNDGGALFSGTFNTTKANQDAAVPGTRYMWGTEEPYDASVRWTKQTMVFPITWQ